MTDERSMARSAERAEMAKRNDRVADFVAAAIGERRPPLSDDDLFLTLRDVFGEVEDIRRRDAHPDDVDSASSIVGILAAIWISAEEIDEIYLGGEEP